MTEAVEKFHNTPPESFRPRLPLAKTSRELELEVLLEKALDVITKYDRISLLAHTLVPPGYQNSATGELERVAKETSQSTHDFIGICRKLLKGE